MTSSFSSRVSASWSQSQAVGGHKIRAVTQFGCWPFPAKPLLDAEQTD